MDALSKPQTRPTVNSKTWAEECKKVQRVFESYKQIGELRIVLPFCYAKQVNTHLTTNLGQLAQITITDPSWTERDNTHDAPTSAQLVFKRAETSYIYFEINLPPIYNYQTPEEISPLLNMLYVEIKDDRTILQYRIATTDHLVKRFQEFKEMVDIFYRVHCQPHFPKSYERSGFVY